MIGSIAFGPLVIVIEYVAEPPGATTAVDAVDRHVLLVDGDHRRDVGDVDGCVVVVGVGATEVVDDEPVTVSWMTSPALRPMYDTENWHEAVAPPATGLVDQGAAVVG